ncbi:ferroxidase HEPHL1-like [Nematolebias whitei]|uniref:ferroxidase HEPHL1-like n=1 Tax=Nematolebias whitei TaxID=451745 RepID=UPI0018981B68|nr:ferroxidase HEPHL1-like [Nematolebias whitei]
MDRTLGLFAGCVLVVGLCARGGAAVERVYYVGIIEDYWDYAPSGKNLINGKTIEEDEHAHIFLEKGPQRIGRVYKKAMYREYTDASFTCLAPRPAWLGILGPIMKAEVNDVIKIHLRNFASRVYSLHPHGIFYEKDSEGAFYPDGTSGRFKHDDMVPPGGSYTYRWEVKPEYAPTSDDANCLSWLYHSHYETAKDINSGLIGPLLTCKKGTLNKQSSKWAEESGRYDVDHDIFMLFTVMDENMSWHLKDNVQSCTDPEGVVLDDPEFMESNKMHVINGYSFGNLPGIELCQHRTVAWHLFGIGNEVDVHSAFFQGSTLLDRGHRTDTISLFPATFVTANMVPKVRGKWLLSCQVNDHLEAGMQAFYEVKTCDNKPSSSAKFGFVRQFYLAAETVLWHYAPSGKNLITNTSLTETDSASEVFFSRSNGHIGGNYKKVIFQEYIDNTFTTKKPRTAEYKHLGILGPVLRAEDGDTFKVTFLNKADRSYSIHPHGVQYNKHFQGTSYEDGDQRSHVSPGEKFTYIWNVLEGPSPSDPPCIPYIYYSAVDPVMDTNSGLIGPLLVCKKGELKKDKKLKGVLREFFLFFFIVNENKSWYLRENIEKFGSSKTNEKDEAFQESNMMHAVNGLMYGNLFGLDMCAGDNVVWYTFGMGSEADIHGIYFEGNTFNKYDTTRDTVSVFAHTSQTLSMQPTIPGVFEVSCRTTDHFSAGMRQFYQVNFCPKNKLTHRYFEPTRTVQYFISSEEIEWDFSPTRDWELERYQTIAKSSPGNVFVGRADDRIGSRYMKAVYREYTDETFQVLKTQQTHQGPFGILGPIIRAEVGEQIAITFKNKASRPYSISPHGVRATGAHVPVQPGHIVELTWDVPESSGPGPSDPNCIPYAYYSTVDFIKDLNSGLVGPLVICRRGTLSYGPDRYRRDTDKEFALLFMIFNENQSWYIDDNIRHYLGYDPEAFKRDDGFEESNKMHGINGKVYGNLHGLEMMQGQKVTWYLMGLGNEVDIHTVHFHAETFTYKTDGVHRADVLDLIPGTFQTVEMVAGNPGTWFLHCHVHDHIMAGMETVFTIKKNSSNGSRTKVSFRTLMLGLLAAKMHH